VNIVRRVIGPRVAVGVLAGCCPVTPVADPSAAPATGTPTTSTAPTITDIPAAAFLQTKDVGKGGYLIGQGQAAMPSAPWWRAPRQSDSMLVVREEVLGTYRLVGSHDTVNKWPVLDGYVYERNQWRRTLNGRERPGYRGTRCGSMACRIVVGPMAELAAPIRETGCGGVSAAGSGGGVGG
jgi:hypothetical protein